MKIVILLIYNEADNRREQKTKHVIIYSEGEGSVSEQAFIWTTQKIESNPCNNHSIH